MIETTIDELVARAAKDKAFRARMIKDPRGTLSDEKLTLAAEDGDLLEEYSRVAGAMSEAELDKAIAEYLTVDANGRRNAAM